MKTKQELMETYTAEQLAEMVVNANIIIDGYRRSKNILKNERFNNEEVAFYETEAWTKYHENSKLQSEVEKYRKSFENANNELKDLKIKIEEEYKTLEIEVDRIRKNERELSEENAELHCKLQAVNAFQKGYPTEPIKVADMLINYEGEYEHNPIAKALYKEDKDTYHIFDISELRQIAEHLLVYCNHNGEVEE